MPNYHKQTSYTVILPNAESVGVVRYDEEVDGWRFYFRLDDGTLRRPGRKAWKTADGALPTWAKAHGAKCV